MLGSGHELPLAALSVFLSPAMVYPQPFDTMHSQIESGSQALPTIFSLNLFSRKVNLSLPYGILKLPLALLLLSHAKVDPLYFLPPIFGVPRTPVCLFIFFKNCIYYVLK